MDSKYGEVVISARTDLGQFQCNGALAAAKIARQNPRIVAESVLANVSPREIFADLSLAGPGFINITLTDQFLAEWLRAVAADERLGCPSITHPETIVVDYGGANVAKSMHIGHLRSAIIGESIKRILRFKGHHVIGDVHLGDWGLQMGMLITELRRHQPELPYFDPEFSGVYPEESPVTIQDLEQLYPAASARAKSDTEAMEASRQATAELQAGRPGYLALWRHFVAVSMEVLRRDYGSLGVEFDLWLGESDAQPRIPTMVQRLRDAGFVELSDGAEVIQLPPSNEEEREVSPLILVKSDGGAMYGTTDLATIEQRVEELHADRILYVVDARQSLHFEQVFRAAYRTGVAGNAKLEHLAFGTMNGTDGRPFKTRAGGTMKLHNLVELAQTEATKKMKEAGIGAEYPADEQEEIVRMVGVGSLKYADLSNHRTSDYVFDPEKFVRFEGKTGAYLLYAAVRMKSILRKILELETVAIRPVPLPHTQTVEAKGIGFLEGTNASVRVAATIQTPSDKERDLVLMLTRFPDEVDYAADRRAPNYLCEYAYNLAQAFSRFYDRCHILREKDSVLRASWLGLVKLCLDQLTTTLELLGMEVPERM